MSEQNPYTINETINIHFTDVHAAEFARAALLFAGRKPEDIGLDPDKLKNLYADNPPAGVSSEFKQYVNTNLTITGMSADEFGRIYHYAEDVSQKLQAFAKNRRAAIKGFEIRYSVSKGTFVPILTITDEKSKTTPLIEALQKYGIQAECKESRDHHLFIELSADERQSLLNRLDRMTTALERINFTEPTHYRDC